MGLDLLVIKFGFLPALGRDHALAKLMDFEHVFGRFLFCEREHFHEHEDNIAHQIHRIVPDNNAPVLFKSFFDFFLSGFNRSG